MWHGGLPLAGTRDLLARSGADLVFGAAVLAGAHPVAAAALAALARAAVNLAASARAAAAMLSREEAIRSVGPAAGQITRRRRRILR